MFCGGIRAERNLIETASLHLAHRWYLGYALDEPLSSTRSSAASARASGCRASAASSSA
jgi:hypothetical protein